MIGRLCQVAVLLLILGADPAPTDRYPRADLLIEVAELAKPEVARALHIVDVRPQAAYQAGHIPNAVWLDHDAWNKTFNQEPDPVAWGKRIGALGIGSGTSVVIYDDDRSRSAARIWWMLRYFGFTKVRLLNGSWTAWKAAKGKIDTGEGKPTAVEVQLKPAEQRLTSKNQLLEMLKGKPLQIVDARSAGEYCGDTKSAKRNGAIPGARQLEWSELLDPKTQKFKTPTELNKLFKDADIDPTRPSVTYCQSGGRASVMAFTLELMGNKDVRNYYRSWAEWGNAEDTPIEKPTPKK